MKILLCWAGLHKWRVHRFNSSRRVCDRCKTCQRITYDYTGESYWEDV